MKASTLTEEPNQVAVRCNTCQRVVAYKLATGGGRLQMKCPKCGNVVKIDLSYRRVSRPLYYRTATVPLSVPMR